MFCSLGGFLDIYFPIIYGKELLPLDFLSSKSRGYSRGWGKGRLLS